MFTTKIADGELDPIAFITTARELARTLEPDAELVELAFKVPPSGRVQFPYDVAGKRLYVFRSAKRGRPEHPPKSVQCLVVVEINRRGSVFTARSRDDYCSAPFVKPPRCTFTQIWDKALAKRATAEDSSLAWDHQQWSFHGLVDGKFVAFRFRDDCP